MTTNFFATEETVTVKLDDAGHYVELKRELTYDENNALEGASVKAGIADDGKTPKLEYSMKEQRSHYLATYITEWNLTGATGKVVPLPDKLELRKQVVGQLSSKWAEKISAKIDELRAENGDPPAIALPEDAAADPTAPGAGSAPGTLSLLPSGSDAAIPTYSARLSGS